MPTASDVWQAALAYEHVRRKHQGRRKDAVDCLGLIILVAVDLGLAGAERFLEVETRSYSRMPPNRLAAELVKAGCIRMPRPMLGTIGTFAQPGLYPTHVGLFGPFHGEHGEMIHASNDDRRVVKHGYAGPWPGQLRGVFGYPGVDYRSCSDARGGLGVGGAAEVAARHASGSEH